LTAATAITEQAEIATVNQLDFKDFVPHGLKLTIVPGLESQSPLHLRLATGQLISQEFRERSIRRF